MPAAAIRATVWNNQNNIEPPLGELSPIMQVPGKPAPDPPPQMLWSQLWLHDAPPELARELAALAVTRSFGDGELLYAQGDPAMGLIGVLSGMVRQVRIGADGRRALVGLFPSGTWFGEISLFDQGPRPFTAYADGATQILFVPAAQLRQLLDSHPEWYRDFARLLCKKLRLAFDYIEDGYKPLAVRIAKRLIDLAQGFGDPSPQGLRIKLRISQQELAEMLGASRQSVNKELGAFERREWLMLEAGRIVLRDPVALAEFVAESD